MSATPTILQKMSGAALLVSLLATSLYRAAIAQDNLPDPARMLTQPTNCTGWPEPRMWIEAQSWWTDPGFNVSTDALHFHIGGCMPYNQTLSGQVTFDILFQLHYNPDYLVREIYFLAPLPYNASGIITDTTNHRLGSTGIIDWSCPRTNLTCGRVFRITIDTTQVPHDCAAGLRVRAETGLLPDVIPNIAAGNGYMYVPELSFPVRFANGNPACPGMDVPDYLPEVPTISTAFNDFPWSYTRMSIVKDQLPTQAVSGKWTIRQLLTFDQRLFGRVSPVVAPVTRTFVTVDPRFHRVDPVTGARSPLLGTVQLDINDLFYSNLVIDTTTLTNGRHVLFFRSDSYIEPGTILPDTIPWLPGATHAFSGGLPHPGGTASAVLTFSFLVNNPVPPPPPPPPVASLRSASPSPSASAGPSNGNSNGDGNMGHSDM